MNKNFVTVRFKLISVFAIVSLLVFFINCTMYFKINQMSGKVERIYEGNVALSTVLQYLDVMQESLTQYLNTKSSDSIALYYEAEQLYQAELLKLHIEVPDETIEIMVEDIRNLSDNYLAATEETIRAKRGRLMGQYKVSYHEACRIYGFLSDYLDAVNETLFTYNTTSYQKLMQSLKRIEMQTTLLIAGVSLSAIFCIVLLARTITYPLKELAETAGQVAAGNLNITLPEPVTLDEIGVVTNAFNQMVNSLHKYIEKMKESMQKENELNEKQLKMEAGLKEAELKYLQAQIHPHFLFNTLNAGAQLAMLEEADRTYEYIQAVAKFFRYKIGKNQYEASLQEELEIIEDYIYILNVRFSGEIHYEKEVDAKYLQVKIPKMVLQPIVENSVKYGIRGMDGEGIIWLSVYTESDSILVIEIADNGIGMEPDLLSQIGQGKNIKRNESNGVGIANVRERLELSYGERGSIKLISQGIGTGLHTIIRIPITDRGC